MESQSLRLCATSSRISLILTCHLFISSHKNPLSPHLFHQGDQGGRLTLQKRWTSFLKARLMCSLPEYDFHFNMLRSVFVMPGHTPQDTLFYGIFGLEWWVCRRQCPRVQMSQAQMKGADQYAETAEADREGVRQKAKGKWRNDEGLNISLNLEHDLLEE